MLRTLRLTTIVCTLVIACSTPLKTMAQSGVCSWGSSEYTWRGKFSGSKYTDIASADGVKVYMYVSTGLDFMFSTWNPTPPSIWGGADYTWAADFNGDGKTDIASANGGNVYMHLSQGSGFD